MKLISLELQNFRQHLDTRVSFTDGLTGIIGPNGSGKTTILEAIAWALYGAAAVRGTNDTIRCTASEGGAKASAALTFDLGGTVYMAKRTLDSGGRSGNAVLEVDGRPLRSGMSEVTAAVGRLLGMDYQAFFTSFFTGQKQLEFMAALDGRQRAGAISRMLGYDRLTKARDQANEDKKGLQREIDGLERGLPNPEELKQRKSEAKSDMAKASEALAGAEVEHKSALERLDRLKPLKEASDQKAKRQEEVSHRLEIDRRDITRSQSRLAELKKELANLESKRKELDSLQPDLKRFEEAKVEFRRLADLQKHEGERQQLAGKISVVESAMEGLASRQKALEPFVTTQGRAGASLALAEKQIEKSDTELQSLREAKAAREHSLEAQARQLEVQQEEIKTKRARIAQAGADGNCPTCERPLAGELAKVLANFDSQISDISSRIASLRAEKRRSEADVSRIAALQAARDTQGAQLDRFRTEKTEADAKVAELASVKTEIKSRSTELSGLREALAKLPTGFDQARYRELQKVGEDLRHVRETAVAINAALERAPAVRKESEELTGLVDAKGTEISESEKTLSDLAFSPEEHAKLTQEYDTAAASLNAAALLVEQKRGEVRTAAVVLQQIEKDEETYRSKLGEVERKRSERLHLDTLAKAFDALRADLNDRIRPELESIASELLAEMTDGRYNVLEVSDSYQATIRDDGELKPVISGGEDDIVNLALRLAISQMIADRAGQSFSLLVLDEVFGSLDDVRRDNVVAMLQNMKNRFEQIILITHVESIHDAVDNCLWVEFDEKTKTSRLTDRSEGTDESEVGMLIRESAL